MEIDVAPFVFHCKVADCPALIAVELVVKLVITGGLDAAVTVIVADAVTVPPLPTAVRV